MSTAIAARQEKTQEPIQDQVPEPDPKPVIFIAANDSSQFSSFQRTFEEKGFPCQLIESVHDLLNASSTTDDSIVFISWNLKNVPLSELVAFLTEKTYAECTIFAESDDMKTAAELASSGFSKTIQAPFTEKNFLLAAQTIVKERLEDSERQRRKERHQARLQAALQPLEDPEDFEIHQQVPAEESEENLESVIEQALTRAQNDEDTTLDELTTDPEANALDLHSGEKATSPPLQHLTGEAPKPDLSTATSEPESEDLLHREAPEAHTELTAQTQNDELKNDLQIAGSSDDDLVDALMESLEDDESADALNSPPAADGLVEENHSQAPAPLAHNSDPLPEQPPELNTRPREEIRDESDAVQVQAMTPEESAGEDAAQPPEPCAEQGTEPLRAEPAQPPPETDTDRQDSHPVDYQFVDPEEHEVYAPEPENPGPLETHPLPSDWMDPPSSPQSVQAYWGLSKKDFALLSGGIGLGLALSLVLLAQVFLGPLS